MAPWSFATTKLLSVSLHKQDDSKIKQHKLYKQDDSKVKQQNYTSKMTT
jgi:hypothetical protein